MTQNGWEIYLHVNHRHAYILKYLRHIAIAKHKYDNTQYEPLLETKVIHNYVLKSEKSVI